MVYKCPSCGVQFTAEDVNRQTEREACYLLYKHGLSLRAIGKLLNLKHESVKFRIGMYERTLNEEEVHTT